MNATGLPATPASPAPAQPAGETVSTANAQAQAPTDFMMALAQMIGASVPTSVETTGLIETDADTDATDDAAALALLPLPVTQMPTQMPQPQMQSSEVDPLELLGLNPRPEGASARDAALLQAMTDRLAAASEASDPHAPETNPAFMPTVDTQQPLRTTADGAITRPVSVPVGTPAWADEIGSRLTLMTQKGEHTASLRLSPEHLGPLEIRIAMRDDQASVWFGAAHADTRAAIEHALPRLRDMFSAQGMSLADAGVFREPPRQQAPTFTNHSSGASEAAPSADAVASVAHVKIGLLDAYA